MALLRMSKNDAVNILLRTQGLPSVTWGDPNVPPGTFGSSEERDANNVIDEATRDLQDDRDWHWNWVEDRSIATDGTNKVPMPTNVARVDYTLDDKREGDITQDRITERNGFLYNLTKETFDFGATGTLVHLKITFWLDFVDLPHSFKRFIVENARQLFLMDKERAPEVIAWSEKRIQAAHAAIERDDELREEPNILRSYSVGGRMLPRQLRVPHSASG